MLSKSENKRQFGSKPTISTEEVRDYIHCPQMYKFKHIDKKDIAYTLQGTLNQKLLLLKFDRDMHRLVYRFFHFIQDETYPSAGQMKTRWGNIWCENRKKEDIMFFMESWRDQRRKLERKGNQAILRFLEAYKEAPGVPIMIGMEYRVELGKYLLSGVIELARIIKEDGKEIVELIDFKVDDGMIQMHVRHDIELTAASFAFRKTMKVKEGKLTYYDLITGEVHQAKRDKEDYQQLYRIVDNVYKAIGANIFYPVMDERCNKCPYVACCARKEW